MEENLQTVMLKLKSPDEEERRKVLGSLRSFSLAEAESGLFTAMGDESWRVRKEAVDVFLSLPGACGDADKLVALLRSHDNAGLRNSAVEALTRLGKSALPALHAHAVDPDQDVRKFVIDIMGSIADSLSVPVLLSALGDADANVCAAAAENLGKIGDVRAVPPLVQALDKSDVWLRYTILEALGRIGEPIPVTVISRLASENLLKKAVYDCIGEIGTPEAVPVLLDGLKERLKNAREAAVTAIVKLRDRIPPAGIERVDAGLRELKGSPYVEGLAALLETSDSVVKESVVKVLSIIGDERTTKDLLTGCKDERLRRYCLQAFKTMGDAGMSSLVKVFPLAGNEERCFIAYLCGEIGFKGCLPMLREGMLDQHPLLRRASAVAAGKVGLTEALPEVAALLEDDDPDVRDGAVDGLSKLASQDAATVLKIAQRLSIAEHAEKRRNAALLFKAIGEAEKLSLLIKDEDAIVRKTAVNALVDLKVPVSTNAVMMALADENPEVRIAAVTALADITGKNAMEPLRLVLQDEDPWVRSAALRTFGKLGGDQALEAVAGAMDSADGLVMIAAIEALERIGGKRALGLMKRALEDSDEEVVKTAIDTLARYEDAWIHEYRDRLLSHPHWDVRNSFVRAMAGRLGVASLPYLRQAYETEGDDMVKAQIREQMDKFA